MLHTCAVKFDVLRILKKIAKIFESKQGSGLAESSHVFACTCAFLAYASIFFSFFNVGSILLRKARNWN